MTPITHRRRFNPATRPLNKHERLQRMLNKYEDSLEAKKPTSSKRKKKRIARSAQVAEPREQNLAHRATERRMRAMGL